MFGAKGDGVTDDTLSIQQAIDTNSPVYFTKEYLISSPLTGKNSIFGNGKIFYEYDTNQGRKNDKDSLLIFDNISNISISDITINGNRDTTKTYGESSFGEWGYGIVLRGCKNISINHVTSINCQGDGIGIAQDRNKKNSENIIIRNCTFNNNYRNGVSITGGFSVTIENCYSENSSGYCAIIVEPDSNSNSNIDKIYISNNTIKNIDKAGFTISAFQHENSSIKNITINNNFLSKTGSTTGSAQYSILFGGTIDNIELINNYIFANTVEQSQIINFGITSTEWALNVLLKGNIFTTDSTTSNPYAIYVCGHHVINILNNTFKNIGMYFNDNPEIIIIEGNSFEYDSSINNVASSLLLDCICQYFIFKNNTVITPIQFIFDKTGTASSIENTDKENINTMIVENNIIIYNGQEGFFVTLFRSKIFNIEKLIGQNNSGDLAKAIRTHRINKGTSNLGVSTNITVYNDSSELPSNGSNKALAMLVNDDNYKFGFYDATTKNWKFIPIESFSEDIPV